MSGSVIPLLPTPRLQLGMLVATPDALRVLQAADVSVYTLVNQHARHDWGDVCEADRQQSDLAAANGARVLSSYPLPTNQRIWVITEPDCSVTTVLLPEEY
ncbi:hypothetical protein [Burkholderia cepacia]|uniref:hypothetical protein n=1 Tax=Burkholderia cepacia TaxID=292 RepID=UPI000753D94E|nr:hypothetical protein [Burkholderia cepacia]KVH31365.1 hypothetical protein WS88_28815 [Burkholderia cepacia]